MEKYYPVIILGYISTQTSYVGEPVYSGKKPEDEVHTKGRAKKEVFWFGSEQEARGKVDSEGGILSDDMGSYCRKRIF